MTEHTGYRPRIETGRHLRPKPNKPKTEDPLVKVAPLSPHAKGEEKKPHKIGRRIGRRIRNLAVASLLAVGLNTATDGGVEETLQGVKEGFVQAITGKEQIEPYSDRIFDVEFREFPTGELDENGNPIMAQPVFRDEPNENKGAAYSIEDLIDKGYVLTNVNGRLVKGEPYNEGQNTEIENEAERERSEAWGISKYNQIQLDGEKRGIWFEFETVNKEGDKIKLVTSLNFADPSTPVKAQNAS